MNRPKIFGGKGRETQPRPISPAEALHTAGDNIRRARQLRDQASRATQNSESAATRAQNTRPARRARSEAARAAHLTRQANALTQSARELATNGLNSVTE